jgi:hypothetical protein
LRRKEKEPQEGKFVVQGGILKEINLFLVELRTAKFFKNSKVEAKTEGGEEEKGKPVLPKVRHQEYLRDEKTSKRGRETNNPILSRKKTSRVTPTTKEEGIFRGDSEIH